MLNITVIVRNAAPVEVKALTYSALPKSATCPVARGTLNGQDYSFKLTKGRGRGSVMMHYAYFVHDGKIYYFTVGGQLPDSGVEVRIGDWKPEEAKEEAPAAEVQEEAPKAPKAPRKSARSKKVEA